MKSKRLPYIEYDLENFILDNSFINFATNKDNIDTAKWEKWFSQNPKNYKTALEAKMLIKHLRFKNQELPGNLIDDEWLKLSIRLELNEIRQAKKNRKSVYIRKIGRITAAASILLLFTSLLYYFISPSINDSKNLVFQEHIVKKGEVKNLLLSDGTIVFINSDSKLKYEENFGKNSREIYLEGEAWFDVSHNSKLPFIVHTLENDITVTGTAFNVHAYPNENTFRTSLERGKISVSHCDEKAVELQENQTYFFLKDSNKAKICDTENTESFSSWKDGKTVFRNQTFTEILLKLERSHNVTFNLLNENVADIKFTGNFSTKDDINTILKVIKLSMAFDYEISNDTIIIK